MLSFSFLGELSSGGRSFPRDCRVGPGLIGRIEDRGKQRGLLGKPAHHLLFFPLLYSHGNIFYTVIAKSSSERIFPFRKCLYFHDLKKWSTCMISPNAATILLHPLDRSWQNKKLFASQRKLGIRGSKHFLSLGVSATQGASDLVAKIK